MKKNLLFLIITLMLITASVFIITSYAADGVVEPIHSGEWGDLHWTLNENTGELIISGSGDMDDFSLDEIDNLESNHFAPAWHSYRAKIVTVEIQNGITSIGDYAFYQCTSLASITFPDYGLISIGTSSFNRCTNLTSATFSQGLSRIENLAFYRCSNLTTVNFSYGLKSIGYAAFAECNNLTHIALSDELESIGNSVFANCGSLKSLTIPRNLKIIETDAFFCCGLNDVYVTDVESWLNISFGDKDSHPNQFATLHILDRNGTESIDLVLSDQVTNIRNYAFENYSGLTNITIPNSVTRIGDYAFSHCSNLKTITFPKSITSLGENILNGCDGLTDIYITDVVSWLNIDIENRYPIAWNSVTHILDQNGNEITELVIPEGITSIRDGGAFRDCVALRSVKIPNGVTDIGSSAFLGCYNITRVDLPDSIINIGGSAFSGCYRLTDITIPDSITSIGSYAFDGCSGLTSFTIPDGVSRIENGTFSECYNLTNITIPDGITYIGDSAFYKCDTLTNIELPYGVESIGKEAFRYCSGLIRITLPESIVNISSYAFHSCENLINVIIPEGVTSISEYTFYNCINLTQIIIPKNVTNIGYSAFNGCNNLKNVSLSEGVISIGKWAFAGCNSLKNITIPSSITTIGDNAFNGCGLDDIYIYDVEAWLNISFGNIESYPNRSGTLHFIDENGNDIKDITFSKNITQIGTYSFCNSTIVSILLTDNITDIGYRAFANCYGLKNILIPEGVISIGDSAFSGCSSLESVTIPDSVISLGDSVFSLCSSLESVTIPEGIVSIGGGMFYECTQLCNINIPNSIVSIGNSAFYGCYNLKTLTIPSRVTMVENAAFLGCTGLKHIYISDINAWLNIAFEDWTAKPNYYGALHILDENGNEISELVIPDSITEIWEYAFMNSTLISIIIPDSVVAIDSCAFSNCTNLKSLKIGKGVTHIGYNVFSGCNSLEDIFVTDIEAWLNISYGQNDYDNNHLNYYGTLHFIDEDGNEITEIIIPNSITEIRNYAFMNSVFTSIEISNSVTSIGEHAFYNCNNLTNVVFATNSSLTGIGAAAFSGCSSLTSIAIPVGIVSIGNSAFWGCNSLTSILLPNSITEIGEAAFGGCSQLTNITLPESISTITNFMFYGCSSLETVVISSNITSIGYRAFYECDSLETVFLPYGFTSIGSEAFYNSGLRKLYVPNTITNIAYQALLSSPRVHVIYCGTVDEWSAVSKSDFNVNYFGRISYHEYQWSSDEETHSGVCTLCEATYAATSHEFIDMGIVQQPTHTQEGIRTYTCKDCSKTKNEAIEKLPEHDYEYKTWEYHDEQQHKKVCACGDTIYEAHGEWQDFGIYKFPTHFEDGIQRYQCPICYGTKDETIPKEEHNLVCYWYNDTQHEISCNSSNCDLLIYEDHTWGEPIIQREATHYRTGIKQYICLGCNKIKQVEIEKLPDHTYDDWIVTQQPTEETPGVKEKACACGHTITEAIPVLEHDYEEIVTKPTCVDQGYTNYTCKNCGHQYKDNYVSANGHSYDNDKDATCNKCYYKREIVQKQPANNTPTNTNQKESSNKNVGPIIGVTIGGLGVGSFAVYWFVLRKKKKL